MNLNADMREVWKRLADRRKASHIPVGMTEDVVYFVDMNDSAMQGCKL